MDLTVYVNNYNSTHIISPQDEDLHFPLILKMCFNSCQHTTWFQMVTKEEALMSIDENIDCYLEQITNLKQKRKVIDEQY